MGTETQDVSARIKELAEGNEIIISLTAEQASALLEQWDDKDPTAPAKIRFAVDEQNVAEIHVAAYRYRGSSCCV
ncbi:hypothetical protein [Nonomuraea typhae]|uniref:hypothetical protein n=1 Tax=Nonomuraea typhae TaxID=2603600 RepID=UPI0012FC1FD6|nr:hypothetical protein [Nonomuraea typhae]